MGPIPLGAARHASLVLTNLSENDLEIELAASPPFAPVSSELVVSGGASATIGVVFRPVVVGAAEGVLRVTGAGRTVAVALRGKGISPCAATDACHAAAFDVDAGRCIAVQAAEGTPCTGPCIDGGTCRGGACVGTFTTCDDGDACTVDACGPNGACLHARRECPISDPCRVERCDPTQGCISEPIADGTLCGAAECTAARVCIEGSCVDRPNPTAAIDCRYTAVCASWNYTCAATVSEKLRCWGSGRALGHNSRVVSPHFVPGALQVKAPICDEAGPSWLTSSGVVGPRDPFQAADAGLGPLVDVHADREGWLGLDVRGTAKLVRPFDSGVAAYAESGASRLFPGLCVLQQDAGVRCGGTTVVFPGRTPLDMAFAGNAFKWAGLFASGTVETSTGLVLVDGGASAVGSVSGRQLCWAVPGALRCEGASDMGGGISIPWPDSIAVATSGGGAICGLSDAGRLTCWGENIFGETSDRSTEPAGLIRIGDGGFTNIAVGFGEVLLIRGDEVLATGSLGYDFDGGRRLVSTGLGDSSLVSLGHFSQLTGVGSQCVIRAGAMWCWSAGTPLRFVAPDIDRLCRTVSCGIDRTGRMWCMSPGGTAGVRATGLSPTDECPLSCRLHSDGGITCPLGPWPDVAVHLPGPATFLTESTTDGCALVTGDVWCWRNLVSQRYDGGLLAQRVSGLRSPVRILRGVDGYRCVVSGQNGLQCWDGIGPVVDVAVSEAIVDIEIGNMGWGTNACLRYANGQVDCFGNNRFGQLGFVPNTGQRAVPVER